MKIRQIICITCTALLALPLFANADVYKWIDKNGEVRYTDTPPPSNIKVQPIGRKKVTKPTGAVPLAPEAGAAKVPATKEAAETVNKEDDAANLRQKNAEIEKRNKQEQEAQAKLKEENCKAAKANHESYVQGGRVYKTNEKGEREYLGDKDLKDEAEKTQNEINEYCN